MSITLWGRNDHAPSREALRFLQDVGVTVDRMLDLDRQPPSSDEMARIRAGLDGKLAPAVDPSHKDFAKHFPGGVEQASSDYIAEVLREDPGLWRAPLLLTDGGAVAGFREQAWRRLLGLDGGEARASVA